MIIDRAFIFVPMTFIDQANALAAQTDPDTGGDETFGKVQLVRDDGVEYTACSTAILTQAGLDAIAAALPQMPGAAYYLESAGWTWETALVDMGLQQPVEEQI